MHQEIGGAHDMNKKRDQVDRQRGMQVPVGIPAAGSQECKDGMENVSLVDVTEVRQGREYERSPNRERSREHDRRTETAPSH